MYNLREKINPNANPNPNGNGNLNANLNPNVNLLETYRTSEQARVNVNPNIKDGGIFYLQKLEGN